MRTMVEDSLTEREKTLRAALAVRMYRAEHNGETVLRKIVLASLVTSGNRERRQAVEHIDAMCGDRTAPLSHAIGGGAVELAERNDEKTMHEWVAAYVARMDAEDKVSVPAFGLD